MHGFMRRDLSDMSQVMGQTTMPPKTKGAKWPNWVEVVWNLEIPKGAFDKNYISASLLQEHDFLNFVYFWDSLDHLIKQFGSITTRRLPPFSNCSLRYYSRFSFPHSTKECCLTTRLFKIWQFSNESWCIIRV